VNISKKMKCDEFNVRRDERSDGGVFYDFLDAGFPLHVEKRIPWGPTVKREGQPEVQITFGCTSGSYDDNDIDRVIRAFRTAQRLYHQLNGTIIPKPESGQAATLFCLLLSALLVALMMGLSEVMR
jgi:hypothetical protein